MNTENLRQIDQQQRRPTSITLLSLFFVLGTLASGLTVVMLLLPGTSLDLLWRINPPAHEAFAGMKVFGVYVMSMVCLSCAMAAVGLWRGRRWGFWIATSMLSVNLLGDAINFLFLSDWRTLIGLPIAGLMIAGLWWNRKFFEAPRLVAHGPRDLPK